MSYGLVINHIWQFQQIFELLLMEIDLTEKTIVRLYVLIDFENALSQTLMTNRAKKGSFAIYLRAYYSYFVLT